MMRELFYRPSDGYVGDVIPYYEEGIYYLYYLFAHRNPDKYGEGTSWYLVTTTDFVHYKEYGEVLPHEAEDKQDLNAYTGSILKRDGVYYLYYTGYNAHSGYCVQEAPLQAVMMAKSDNLFVWEKLPAYTFYASEEHYELSDWRDPFVFYNEEQGEYWMLLAARLKAGACRRRGCIGLCTSKNLYDWTAAAPIYAPGLYMTHECPEIFKMGEWWYLIYSSFSERFATHYRMSRTLAGPFSAPEEDTFDGRGFYAGKTASDGSKRYIFGWIPTRKEESDYGDYEWAGNLLVHELIQRKDGTLYASLPESVKRNFNQEIPINIERKWGCFSETEKGKLEADSYFELSTAVTKDDLPVNCMITVKFRYHKGTKAFGMMLRSDGEADAAYYLRIEPGMNRMVFDMWPRKQKRKEEDTWEIYGDKPFFAELERKCLFKAEREYSITVILDETACVAYLDGCTAMSSRIYMLKRGRLGFFVSEGGAEFYDMHLFVKK